MATMNSTTVSRVSLAMLLAAALVAGVILGSTMAAFGDGRTGATPTPTPIVTPGPNADVPRAEVDGEDFARLPRYPGSVRTEYEISVDDRFRLTAVEYLADADLELVRAFYQRVMDDEGWDRADVNYAAGEWTYVLVDGRTEALVELEVWNGLVEIDLQISDPIEAPRPAPPDDDDDDADDDDADDDDADDDDADD
jgi:hypothetical protein